MPAIRFSRQREALAQALRTRRDHPTAEMLYRSLRQANPNISLGTVYRNLTLLESQGNVLRLPGQDGPDRYDGNVVPHAHLFCDNCGGVADLPDMSDRMDLQAIQAEAAHQGMVVKAGWVSFNGLCAACAARRGARAGAGDATGEKKTGS